MKSALQIFHAFGTTPMRSTIHSQVCVTEISYSGLGFGLTPFKNKNLICIVLKGTVLLPNLMMAVLRRNQYLKTSWEWETSEPSH